MGAILQIQSMPKPECAYPGWQDRSYVCDKHFMPLLIQEHDYRPLRDMMVAGQWLGALIIEWDIAIGKEDVDLLLERAYKTHTLGFVAPYKLYPGPLWAHGIVTEPCRPDKTADFSTITVRRAKPTDRWCDMPSFGCTYLPAEVLREWEAPPQDGRLTDTNFALWAWRHGYRWPIWWDVRPVHLHY